MATYELRELFLPVRRDGRHHPIVTEVARLIQRELATGWSLFSINHDRAIFEPQDVHLTVERERILKICEVRYVELAEEFGGSETAADIHFGIEEIRKILRELP